MAKGVQICADFSRADNLCLCVPGGATALNTGLDSVEEVHGHPHMLQACSIFLEKTRVDREAKGVKLGLTERASQDSTSAHSAASKTSAAALIAGRDTAQNLQMVVLSPDVCNDRRSQSRYIIVSKEDPLEIRHSAKAVSSKTTLTVLMRNSPGAIFKLASCFALREMDIINLSQRPAVNAFALHSQLPEAARGALLDHWSVIYFLEFASGGKEKDIAALRDLEEYSLWLKVCGTYASGIEDVSAKPSKAWQELSEKLSTSY
jgi:prephenate dehydratase